MCQPRAVRGFYGGVRKLEARSRAYTTPQNIYQTCPNRPRSHTEAHAVLRSRTHKFRKSEASRALSEQRGSPEFARWPNGDGARGWTHRAQLATSF